MSGGFDSRYVLLVLLHDSAVRLGVHLALHGLRVFAQGRSYAEIVYVRGKSPMTIRNAVYAIQGKLGAGTRQELGVWAARNGLLDEDKLH